MAYWYDDTSPRSGTSRRCIAFYMDSDSDLAELPTSTTEGTPQLNDTTLHLPVGKGSTAFSIDSSSVFMLKSDDTWQEI